MRKIITLFILSMMASLSWATVFTFIPGKTVHKTFEVGIPDTMSLGCVSVLSQYGLTDFGNDIAYRFHKNYAYIFTTSVGSITSIKFTCIAKGEHSYSPWGFEGNAGYEYEKDGYIGIWSGSATSVTLIAYCVQVRATKIEVTVSADVQLPKSPTFSPPAGSYSGPVKVTLNSADNGAEIFYCYSTRYDDRYIPWNLYVAPFVVHDNEGLRAYAVKDGIYSYVVKATYDSGNNPEPGDVDGDWQIGIGDATALIDLLLEDGVVELYD